MNPTEPTIERMFAAFENDQDPGHIHRALAEVESAQYHTMPGDTVACKEVLSLTLGFLTSLDQHIDPKWDPKQAPVRRAPPPPVPGLAVNPSGEVDPAEISDPETRARYEEELKAIKDNSKHYDNQFQLRRIDERATRHLKLFAERCFTGSAADRREFEELINTSSLSNSRKRKLRKLVGPRLWPFN